MAEEEEWAGCVSNRKEKQRKKNVRSSSSTATSGLKSAAVITTFG